MAKQVGRWQTIYCAILIAQYNKGGGAFKEVLNDTDMVQCTIPE